MAHRTAHQAAFPLLEPRARGGSGDVGGKSLGYEAAEGGLPARLALGGRRRRAARARPTSKSLPFRSCSTQESRVAGSMPSSSISRSASRSPGRPQASCGRGRRRSVDRPPPVRARRAEGPPPPLPQESRPSAGAHAGRPWSAREPRPIGGSSGTRLGPSSPPRRSERSSALPRERSVRDPVCKTPLYPCRKRRRPRQGAAKRRFARTAPLRKGRLPGRRYPP